MSAAPLASEAYTISPELAQAEIEITAAARRDLPDGARFGLKHIQIGKRLHLHRHERSPILRSGDSVVIVQIADDVLCRTGAGRDVPDLLE